MNDEELWLGSGVPQTLLNLVRPHASPRMLRLVACAYARFAWHLLTDEPSRNAVITAESFADGGCDLEELAAAQDEAASVASLSLNRDRVKRNINDPDTRAKRLAVAATDPDAYSSVFMGTYDTWRRRTAIEVDERDMQLVSFRDIFGNPFRPVAFDPAWRTPTTTALASRMYDSRDFAAMPILADALEEAGCVNPDILRHCREPGVHVRGCWVVDHVLGKA